MTREERSTRLEDVKEEDEEEGSFVSNDTSNNKYAAPFQEWKVAQDLVRQEENDPQQMNRTSEEAITLLSVVEAPLKVASSMDNEEDETSPDHHQEREIPLAIDNDHDDQGKTSSRSKTPKTRRTIWLLSIVAILLTLGVILIATVTLSSRPSKSSANSNNSNEIQKDPPNDVTAGPTTPAPTLAPIVPGSPTGAPSTMVPSKSPVSSRPTQSPVVPQVDTSVLLEQLSGLLSDASVLSDETTIYNKAYRAIGEYDDIEQRFGIAVLNFAVGGNFAQSHLPTCEWFGITCTREIVTDIVWPNQVLEGSLPTMGLHVLSQLATLDLGENRIRGSIPEHLYDMSALQYLYLYQNQLTGTLSTRIGQLTQLRRLYLGENQMTGVLPQELGSPGRGATNVRPLQYISLYDNRLVGPIPRFWNLRKLYYLDLGKNQLSGAVPSDWTEGRDTMERLRLLYLDENKFVGRLPSNLGEIGKGRLNLLTINDNAFTGEMPLFQNHTNFLNRLEIQNNQFTSMNRFQCAQIVFNGGEMVQMKADCEICSCLWFCGIDECY